LGWYSVVDFHRFRSLRLVLPKPRIEMDTIIKTHAGVNDSRKASTSLQHHLHFNKSPGKKVAMPPTRVEHEYHIVLEGYLTQLIRLSHATHNNTV
jgi:hypothetical protein